MDKKYHKIAVLSGGISAERPVSLVSAKGSYDALMRLGYDAYLIDPADSDFINQLIHLRPDAVLNMLHGYYGEDGTVQGLLESLKIPYSHSGVSASAIAMDKIATKTLLTHYGLPTAPSIEGTFEDIVKNKHKISYPAVLKPVSEGSSLGIVFLKSADDLHEHIDIDKNIKRFMLEKYIAGREMTVAVLNDKALAVTEIIPKNGFYDYDAKYSVGGSSHYIPADISDELSQKMMDYAVSAHNILGCRGVSRTDFRYDENDSHGIIILEINTQPGMTPTSLTPEQAEYVGISYDMLVEILTQEASICR